MHTKFTTIINSGKKQDMRERVNQIFLLHISDFFEILYGFIFVFTEINVFFLKNNSLN